VLGGFPAKEKADVQCLAHGSTVPPTGNTVTPSPSLMR